MDHYADDLAALTAHLDLKNAVHVGHSTGGGEVAHYLGRHGKSRVAKAALISAVPPLMVKTAANPGGLPKEVFDGLQAQLAANRSQLYRDLPAGPFYGFNRPGVKASEAIIQNWWRQGMMGGAKAHYDGIVAFSQTDFTDDLKEITVPVLVMHGDDDQIVPYADAGPLSAKLLKNGTLKTYKGFPHGMPTQRRPARVHQGLIEAPIRKAATRRVFAFGEMRGITRVREEDLKKFDVPTLIIHGDDDSDRPDRRLRPAFLQADQERTSRGLQGRAARPVLDPQGPGRRRPPGIHQGLALALGRVLQ